MLSECPQKTIKTSQKNLKMTHFILLIEIEAYFKDS